MTLDTTGSFSLTSRLALLSTFFVLPFLVGCGDGGGGTEPTPPPTPVATTVVVSPSSASLQAIGATVQLSATVRDQNGQIMTGASVAWSCNDNGVATVSSSGSATAVSAGSAIITAASGQASGTVSVTVTQVVTSVTVSPASQTMVAGEGTVQFTAAVKDANGHAVHGAGVNWSSSDPSRVSVNASTGLATPLQPGSVTISATSAGVSGTASVTVLPRPVASVEVNPSSGSILVDGTVQLTATTRDGAGNVLTGREITWSSSDLAVASVSSAGLVTGLKAGMATIIASSEGKTGSANVTVVAPVASVVVQGIFRIKVGDTYTYTATARLADGTIVQRPITWSVLETSKGHMTPEGVLTPLASGPITLVATIDGVPWEVTAEAYDWRTLASSTSLFVYIDSDTKITNKWGASEYPEIVFSCNATSGKFFAWVDTEYFVTQNGQVTYQFDSGAYIHQTWIEFDSFSALGHPGPTNLQTKNFAATMALARRFGFAFTEFNGPAKATIFRVTGLAPFLSPLFNACPSNSLVADPAAAPFQVMEEWGDLRARGDAPALVRSEQGLREEAGSLPSAPPELIAAPVAPESRPAVRRQ